MSDAIDGLVDELERAAAQLRDGERDAGDAAALVERCAELAARVGAELDRAGREVERAAPGQEQLL